jgi:hypothetical protein
MIFLENINPKDRNCIFIRHGDKDPLTFELTEKGKYDIALLAKKLADINCKIQIYSSPEHRCLETATILNNLISSPNKDIIISTILGMPGIQVKNDIEYNQLTNQMKCREIFKEWKKGNFSLAMNSPEYIKVNMMKFFDNTAIKKGITIYVSQSGTVACSGYSFGLIDYKNNDWVDYLDGFVLRL